MKLLEVVESSGAGVGRHVRMLSQGLIDEGHRVTVAYSPHRTDAAFRRFVADRRDELCFVPLNIRRELSPLSDARSLFQLVALIRREGPFDAVHGHSSKGGALARIAGRLCGVPTVYTPHSIILASPEISRAERFVFLWAERILGHVATSKFVAVSECERALAINLRLTASRGIVLIYNALTDEDFLRSSKANDEDVRDRPLTFGSAIRFTHQKAPADLVEAFVQTSRALPEIPMRLIIAGSGELFSDVKRQVESSGLEEQILLPGWVTNVKSVLQALDVFVLSSLYEGFSYDILEAMAAELPLISTDVCGVEETVAQVQGNMVVPAGDPEALSRSMREMALLARPESLRRSLLEIGRANRRYVSGRFRQREATHRIIDLYRSLARQG